MTEPPGYAVIAAQLAAMKSPCAKSKRGVALFDSVIARGGARAGRRDPLVHGGTGYNGQPEPFRCDGSEVCQSACGKLCMHAEQRAIIGAIRSDVVGPRGADLVHVKVIGGVIVPGGGPSCWQCSRLVVEVGLRGVWLYEEASIEEQWKAVPVTTGAWRFYLANDFHRATLKHEHNRLPVIEAP